MDSAVIPNLLIKKEDVDVEDKIIQEYKEFIKRLYKGYKEDYDDILDDICCLDVLYGSRLIYYKQPDSEFPTLVISADGTLQENKEGNILITVNTSATASYIRIYGKQNSLEQILLDQVQNIDYYNNNVYITPTEHGTYTILVEASINGSIISKTVNLIIKDNTEVPIINVDVDNGILIADEYNTIAVSVDSNQVMQYITITGENNTTLYKGSVYGTTFTGNIFIKPDADASEYSVKVQVSIGNSVYTRNLLLTVKQKPSLNILVDPSSLYVDESNSTQIIVKFTGQANPLTIVADYGDTQSILYSTIANNGYSGTFNLTPQEVGDVIIIATANIDNIEVSKSISIPAIIRENVDFTYTVNPDTAQPIVIGETNIRSISVDSDFNIKYLTISIIGKDNVEITSESYTVDSNSCIEHIQFIPTNTVSGFYSLKISATLGNSLQTVTKTQQLSSIASGDILFTADTDNLILNQDNTVTLTIDGVSNITALDITGILNNNSSVLVKQNNASGIKTTNTVTVNPNITGDYTFIATITTNGVIYTRKIVIPVTAVVQNYIMIIGNGQDLEEALTNGVTYKNDDIDGNKNVTYNYGDRVYFIVSENIDLSSETSVTANGFVVPKEIADDETKDGYIVWRTDQFRAGSDVFVIKAIKK